MAGEVIVCSERRGTPSRRYIGIVRRKLALTDLAPFIVTVQVVPDAASHPCHRTKLEPGAGVAVSVTTVDES